MQLAPSLEQLVKSSAKSLLSKPQVTFVGIMDKEFDPEVASPSD